MASPTSRFRRIGGSLMRRIGKPGDLGRTVDPVVLPKHHDERLAEITKGRFADAAEVLFGHQDPHQAVVKPTQGIRTDGVVAHSPFRLLGQLDLGDQMADGRIACFPFIPGCSDNTCRPEGKSAYPSGL
jgi:hypothetical protein